ncbi:Uncharacterized protein FWK35_00023133 [Aphis craccivora]|uniref:Uncharacterized protein n=1 Tax=Aphis craccivora TaxID=307492 RepID=A0A6G0Z8L0_APHCR|nr:Uncharacterized protein FWK35_00023133 [Aphis craccivora]
MYIILRVYSALVPTLLDSERSNECIDFTMFDECIGFTMMCVFFFFVSVTTFWSMSPVSDGKVNLVGTLGGKIVRKNPEKVTEKREFLRKTSIRPNRFFFMVRNDNDLSSNDFKYFISRRYLKILPFKYRQKFVKFLNICKLFFRVENSNLNSGIFMPLKHKSPFSPTIRNYILG